MGPSGDFVLTYSGQDFADNDKNTPVLPAVDQVNDFIHVHKTTGLSPERGYPRALAPFQSGRCLTAPRDGFSSQLQ